MDADAIRQLKQELTNYLSGLLTKERRNERQWIPHDETREAGERDIPAGLADLFKEDSFRHLYSRTSIADFLGDHPEPRGGHLKAQMVDPQLPAKFGSKKLDEPLFEAQRAILCTIRPLCTVFQRIDEVAEEGEHKRELQEILRETVRYILSTAASIRIQRRLNLAKELDMLPGSEQHWKIGSSDDSRLYGPELIAAIDDEKKRLPKAGPPPRNGARGRGSSSSKAHARSGPRAQVETNPRAPPRPAQPAPNSHPSHQ